ncbi:DarT1-associated NADAR antitoxin family protein [Vibrio parahaemolyticus]|uniref:DarT1-associated NADAR antitoxin family protein n=1 Tax=Vibrio parahaemolyticus TaxID=670 RepID=UPI001C9BEBE9|nr:hypothetical protein [Vibrio parahaemolyticus]MBY8150444.1 hypothetical protein [Vibrio fluvialis]MCR9835008.1 hypothetical protein [Vibrio parahaemolyticus]
MASRPIFISKRDFPFVEEKQVEFTWHPGFSILQKQKSIADLHRSFQMLVPTSNTLEVSSKSDKELGVALSAFNLKVSLNKGDSVAVENLFQASKIFENGGPYKDLLYISPLDAKRDNRLKESGKVIGFKGKEQVWPTEPKTLYYDWIYINALHSNKNLRESVQKFDSFSDIEFNPMKSFNCQARSVALYVSLSKINKIEKVISSPDYYRELMIPKITSQNIFSQQSLF